MWKKKEKERNQGFTLVEVLVSCAILSIALVPILSSFVSVAKVNTTSRKKMTANTICESVMEAAKVFELRDFAYQCYAVQNDATKSDFRIIAPDLVNNTAFTGSAAELSATAGVIRAQKEGDKIVFTPSSDHCYKFLIMNIPMGGTTYDAIVEYEYDAGLSETTFKDATGTDQSVADQLEEFGVRSLKYYDIKVRVYKSESGTAEERSNSYSGKSPLCRLSGTKVDYD